MLAGRPFIKLDLHVDQAGIGVVTGTLSSPSSATFRSPDIVENIRLPILERSIIAGRIDGEKLRFSVLRGRETVNYSLKIADESAALLQVDGSPVAPWRAVRLQKDLAVPADWKAGAVYRIDGIPAAPNSELGAIYRADQENRDLASTQCNVLTESQISAWLKQGTGWRKRTRELIASGLVTTGQDFEKAAFIFQHGRRATTIYLRTR